MEVCKQLEGAGVAANCREGRKEGPSLIAKEMAEFDVPGVSGRTSEVLTFNEDREYALTVKTYDEKGSTNAMHLYGSRERRVFVAIHEKAPPELAEKAKKVVEAL
jgi:hypothetical protein